MLLLSLRQVCWNISEFCQAPSGSLLLFLLLTHASISLPADAKGVAHKEAAAAKQSADVTVAALSEEQLGTIESLAKSTMTEYAQNFLSEDEVVAQVESIKEEVWRLVSVAWQGSGMVHRVCAKAERWHAALVWMCDHS